MTVTVKMEETSVLCTQCGKRHRLNEMKSRPFFEDGKSYFCPVVDNPKEVARARDNMVFYWNGRQFEKVRLS